MAAGRRPPPWRDVRTLAWIFQLAVVAVVVAVVAWLWNNLQVNSDRQNIPTDFGYLDQPAGFPIPSNPGFRQTQPVSAALLEALRNTLRLAVAGIVLATVLGTLLGIARLSRNFLVNKAAQVYVEFVRNVPLLGLLLIFYTAIVLGMFPRPDESWVLALETPKIDVGPVHLRSLELTGPIGVFNVRGSSVLWYEGRNLVFVLVVVAAALAAWLVARWRRYRADRTGRPARSGLYAALAVVLVVVVLWLVLGLGGTAPLIDGRRVTGGITMTPAYLAALLALVVYTSSHIAEIVRGSIQAVPRGQGEAANALALSGFQRMWYVVLPQAMRIALPPIGNQYLNLAKNSSLAAVISFPEITKITELSIANRSPAVPSYTVLLMIYLVLSLALSAIVNLANRRLAIVER